MALLVREVGDGLDRGFELGTARALADERVRDALDAQRARFVAAQLPSAGNGKRRRSAALRGIRGS
jgi:hypothetical protein